MQDTALISALFATKEMSMHRNLTTKSRSCMVAESNHDFILNNDGYHIHPERETKVQLCGGREGNQANTMLVGVS